MFSILQGYINLDGACVLDLYSGSGALAFEALSRGARHAICIEQSRAAAGIIHENAKALDVSARCTIVVGAVERIVGRMAQFGKFDIVFADPPYAEIPSGKLQLAMAQLKISQRLEVGGLLVLEHASKDMSPTVEGLECAESRHYGDTCISIYLPSA